MPAPSRVRVRYAETDKMGVAYYANYLVWFEIGRTDWLRQSGWSYRDMESDGFSLPVVEARCGYRASAKYDDELDVHTRGTLLSPVRVRFDYRIARATDNATLADGHTVHAVLQSNGRPCRLPERVTAVFSAQTPSADMNILNVPAPEISASLNPEILKS